MVSKLHVRSQPTIPGPSASGPTGGLRRPRSRRRRVREKKWRIIFTALVVVVILAANPGTLEYLSDSLNFTFSINLPSPQMIDLNRYVASNVGVPNYAANVVLRLEHTRVNLGAFLRFHLEISQVGTSQAGLLYYDVILSSPNNHQYIVVPYPPAVFPPTTGSYGWGSGGIPLTCLSGPCQCQSGCFVPAQTLLSGNGACQRCNLWNWTNYLWFEWDIPGNPLTSRSYLGTWSIYVFTYAGSYPVQPSTNATNALAYTMDSFQIVPLSSSPSSLERFGIPAATFFADIIAIAATWLWVSPWLETRWRGLTKLSLIHI